MTACEKLHYPWGYEEGLGNPSISRNHTNISDIDTLEIRALDAEVATGLMCMASP